MEIVHSCPDVRYWSEVVLYHPDPHERPLSLSFWLKVLDAKHVSGKLHCPRTALIINTFYTTPHNSGRVLWFHVGHLCVCPSVIRQSYVCPSVFHFRMITSVNINGFSSNLVCALLLWRSGLGFLKGKFHQIFRELSARDTLMAGYYSITFLLHLPCYVQIHQMKKLMIFFLENRI